MLTKILKIIQWILLLGIIAYLTVGFLQNQNRDEPLKEIFYISLEQFPDGSYYLQYSLDGQIQSVGFHEWERYIEFTEHLRTMFIVNEYKSIFQHGVDDIDLLTGRNKYKGGSNGY